jgi:hypothetical protein
MESQSQRHANTHNGSFSLLPLVSQSTTMFPQIWPASDDIPEMLQAPVVQYALTPLSGRPGSSARRKFLTCRLVLSQRSDLSS